MPGSGPLSADDKWEIEIEVTGPVDPVKAAQFDDELRALLAKVNGQVKRAKTKPKQP
ncbi:MAG TPA: hypothetical protein VJU81_08790 [Methylomirabilota bacterium]|nr:hypothetical protein [Methylomirabilota bacterium]